jgi:hypothetical protein
MNVAWIVPCRTGYEAITPYLDTLTEFPWVVHIYHGDYPVRHHKRLSHLPLSKYKKMKGLYAVIHLFTDDCPACGAFTPIPLMAQRIFRTPVPHSLTFNELFFRYLKAL